jgi:hypothetical protein
MQHNTFTTHTFTFTEREAQSIWALINGLTVNNMQEAIIGSASSIEDETFSDKCAMDTLIDIQNFLGNYFDIEENNR